jgi:hypothetical protein
MRILFYNKEYQYRCKGGTTQEYTKGYHEKEKENGISLNSTCGSQAISPMEWSLFWSSIGSGDKGEEDKTVAFLSALDEEHRRWDKIERCEL